MARVVIIEDDLHVREALSIVLRDEGHEVEEHGDGLTALTSLARGPKPDAILLDLMMPIMNGWQFRARQLAQPALASIPTIIMTASGNLDRAGISADEIVLKPFKLERLLATLGRLLEPSNDIDDENDYPTNPYVTPLETCKASWKLAAPLGGESCRWIDETGNWISISLGTHDELGLMLVKSSSGRREAFDSYEDALLFSRSLRG